MGWGGLSFDKMFSWRKTRRKGLIQLSKVGAEGTRDSSLEIHQE